MKITAKSNKELYGIIDLYKQGSYGDLVTINKGIFLKKSFNNRTGNNMLHVAIRPDMFENKYQVEHTQKILDKYLLQLGYCSTCLTGAWNVRDGGHLDIKGVGENTQLAYREIVL